MASVQIPNPLGNQTVQTQAQIIQPQPNGDYVMHLPDVGALTGMIIAAVIGFGYVLSKFKKDTTANAIESNLYKNLSDRIETITKTLERVESEREQLLIKVTRSEARITELERHESENKLLRDKLNNKDAEIEELQKSLIKKQDEIEELKDRVHYLELQMANSVVDCDQCEHRRILDEGETLADIIVPIEGSR